MSVGKLKVTTDNNIKTIAGNIATYSVNLRFRLEPRDSMKDEKSPSHNVIGCGKHGLPFHAGVAWEGIIQATGKPMYTLAINVPELFDGEMKFVGWQNEKDRETFELQFSRDKEDTQQQATAA